MTLAVGSLFSGIGGLDLGLERAGMEVRWQCEIDPYCRKVLAKHWPDIPCYDDVRNLPDDIEPVDLICGGFPCQDISIAGVGAGLEGEHSGLWAYFAGAVSRLRPRYVLVENSPALPVRGLGEVLSDLAGLGYDAEWDCIPASAVDAPHLRARTWILAYPAGERNGLPETALLPRRQSSVHGGWWASEPGVVRVAHGIPSRVDRLRALGNAVVPQIPELIGRAILESMGR